MLARLGVARRLLLNVVIMLVAAGLIGIGTNLLSRSRDTQSDLRFLLPDQAAAIVDLIESVPPERRTLLLRAINTDDLRVKFEAVRPSPPVMTTRFPVAEWLIADYLETFRSRVVEVAVVPGSGSTWLSLWLERLAPNSPLRITIGLRTGEFAVFETRGSATQRLFGMPTGFWIGVLGFYLAIGAVFAVRREAKPMSDLAASITRFADAGAPAIITPRGHPTSAP